MKKIKLGLKGSTKTPPQNEEEWKSWKQSIKSYNETVLPTDEDIENLIKVIDERLSEKRMNKPSNANIKAGFLYAREILSERLDKYEDVDFKSIASLQARALAMIAVDYLNGAKIGEETFKNVPLKHR